MCSRPPAGPIANFLLAAVLFAGLFATVGRPVAVPVIGEVVAEGAAARAGGVGLADRGERCAGRVGGLERRGRGV